MLDDEAMQERTEGQGVHKQGRGRAGLLRVPRDTAIPTTHVVTVTLSLAFATHSHRHTHTHRRLRRPARPEQVLHDEV